jgi:hypothetical protein
MWIKIEVKDVSIIEWKNCLREKSTSLYKKKQKRMEGKIIVFHGMENGLNMGN